MDTRPSLPVDPLPGSDGSGVLTAAWATWVAAHALRGVAVDTLVGALVAAGLAADEAQGAVRVIVASPVFAAARILADHDDAQQRTARLLRSVGPTEVATVERLDEAELYERFWSPHRPVILRGAASGWASSGWTFPNLRSRFGFAPMDVLVREGSWWTRDRVSRRMPFGELVDAALGPASDALYADGRSNVLDQAGLAPLRQELGLLPGLVGDGRPSAWVGPAGTVTPTHYDQSTAWQVVLVGRKRLWLASPLESTLIDSSYGLFNPVDPRQPPSGDQAGVRWHALELGPGDAALVPAGWWHLVQAVEPSFSVSFSGFRWPNAHPWYRPAV